MTMDNHITRNPIAKATMLIRRPVATVFEAFVNPEVTTRFWFIKSSGRLEERGENVWGTLKKSKSLVDEGEHTMTKINIYLNFAGNTEEAFDFYKTVFGGEFSAVVRFKDMPMPG